MGSLNPFPNHSLSFEPFKFDLLQICILFLCSILVLSVSMCCDYFIQCVDLFTWLTISLLTILSCTPDLPSGISDFTFSYSTPFRSSFSKDLLMAVGKTTHFSLLRREKPNSFLLLCLFSLLTPNTSLCHFWYGGFPTTKQFSTTPATT